MEVSNKNEEEENDKSFNIKLGESFNLESSTTNSLLSFRYLNKPKSISSNSIGTLTSSNSNSNGIYATFPNNSSSNNSNTTSTTKSSSQDHRFSGNLVKAKEVECVLIWDEINQCYVLEHLSNTVRLTYDRLPKNGVHSTSTSQSINSPLLSGVDSDSQSSHTSRGRTTTVAPKILNNNNMIEVEDFGSMAITPIINHEVERSDEGLSQFDFSQDVEMRDYGPTSKTGRSVDGSSRERSRHSTPLPPPLSNPSYIFPVPSLSNSNHLLNQSPIPIPFELPTTIAPSSLHSSPAPLSKSKVKPPLKSTTAGKGPSRPTAARKGPAPSTSTSTSTSIPSGNITKKRRRSSIASKTLPPTTHYQNTSSSSPGTTNPTTSTHSGHAQKRLPSNYNNSGHPSSTGTAPNNSRVRPPLPKGTQHSSGASSASSGSGSGSEEDSDDDDDDDDDEEEEDGPEGYLVPLKVAPGSVLSRNISLPSTSGKAFSTGGKGGSAGGKSTNGNNSNHNNNSMRSGKSPIKSTTIGLKSNPTGATTSSNLNNKSDSESQSQSEEDEEDDDSDSSVDAHSLGKLLNNGSGGHNGRRRSSSSNNMTMGTGGKGRGGKGRSVGGKSQMPQKRPQPLPSNNGGGMSFDRMLDSNQDEAARRRAMEAADVPESSEEE